MKTIIKVGVTGGIGSGKSLVCKVFSQLGIPVFNADEEAKQLYTVNNQVKQAMLALFGNRLYINDVLDKKHLAQQIFTNTGLLAKVNAIVHPALIQRFEEWALLQTNVPFVIQEAAILFEAGFAKYMDKTITVSAPEAIRIERVVLRDKLTVQQVKERINNQWTEEQKNKLADYVLYNGENDALLPQILRIYQLLKS